MDDLPDIDMSQIDPVPARETAQLWQEEFQKEEAPDDSLNILLEQYWSKWVPRIYRPVTNEGGLTWTFNEELAQETLFTTLELFIFNGDPTTVLQNINQSCMTSNVCGRFFKISEPTYYCRECGMDKTCVLCVECFKHSQHRFHKYKMGTSGGGGCCDCGDVEAWKQDPYCSIHQINTPDDESKSNIPDDILHRMKIVFKTILKYAFNMLNSDHVSNVKLGGVESNFLDIDSYCTILYNDEVHTFEQVINTLGRVLKTNQRHSTEYVTSIDREGRAIVKCSSFQVCQDLKHEIEKYTSRHGNKPLKVLVCHSYIIAHQIYSMKLLSWLEKFLSHGKKFREVFAQVAQGENGKVSNSIIQGIMTKDASLWKNARTQWHRLLIAGMLLEYENKKALARIFTRNYAFIVKDFIKDDHDHSYSIVSMSVQLFTVPTLAHYLIEHEGVLYILLNTFQSECTKKRNKFGKLEFERTHAFFGFKRTLFMLYDLKYILNSVPEPHQWTDDLRRNFLHAFTVLLQILNMMQGMDSVTRQIGQHMEYEPEWETGFNLHIKLSYCLSSVIQWCASDKVVLVKAYRFLLKILMENPCYEPNETPETRELADHSTSCLRYDVSSKPVSIHLPLSRLLAALHLSLEKYNLHFDGPEFQLSKPTPVQIMEPVLRAQVMVAQVHAGMWRRNGYALLNTLYFYHNVKCRSEMLDRDITLLQIGASLIESNEFLIHVLNKFNLINWALSDFEINTLKSPEEDSMRTTVSLVEEMLQLLIVIIGERYIPGVSNVTTEDKVKKEIIQQLCIKPVLHSELMKTVSEELEAPNVCVDDVIKELADFKKPPHSTAKGVYELKNQYYSEFNVFFYHYSREELSKAEEAQRNRNKAAGQLECCPPPKLPKLNESFTLLVNLLQCDVMLHVMQTVCERCLNLRARSFSENQLQKVLHLIGYGLQEEESGNYVFFKFTENAMKFNIFPLLEELMNSPRVEAHRDLLKWVINKYKSLKNEESNISDDNRPQKMDSEKERRTKMAAEKRAKIMAQMEAMQKSFIKDNPNLFEDTNMDVSSVEEDSNSMEILESQPVVLGPNQTSRVAIEKTYTCILCQEKEKISLDGHPMVLAGFVHQAMVLCVHRDENLGIMSQYTFLYLPSALGPAPHTSTCGHVMHSECWSKFFDNVMIKEHRRPYRLRHSSSFDVDKQEFLCPLCECLSNSVLPVLPPLTIVQPSVQSNILFEDFLSGIDIILKNKVKVCHGIFKCNFSEQCENLHCHACINSSSGTSLEPETSEACEVDCMLQPHQVFYSCRINVHSNELPQGFGELFPTSHPEVQNQMKEMIQVFAQVPYTRGLNVDPHPTDIRLAPMAWKSLAYTIHVIETVLRDANKPLLGHLSSRQRDTVENMTRVVGVLGSTWSKSVIINSHALQLLSIFFSNEESSILQWDSFGMLISLSFALPSLGDKNVPSPAPSGGTLDWHILRIVFISHIVKILILLDVKSEEFLCGTTEKEFKIFEVLKLIGNYQDGLKGSAVWDHVKDACRPFLRCCCLFYHYLTDVPAPRILQEVDGDTFTAMCVYLDLPQTPEELFSIPHIQGLIKKWSSHEDCQDFMRGEPINVTKEPIQPPHLVELPADYSDLINKVSSFTCPNSDEDSRNPTMCLVCGEILCSQSYCCQTEMNKMAIGACNYHALKCGAGLGVFLRVRDCELLLLAAPHRGTFLVPPYLDDYGESDQGLRRGNPLRLCAERYKKLQNIWLSHSIYEEIARQIESGAPVIATQWGLL